MYDHFLFPLWPSQINNSTRFLYSNTRMPSELIKLDGRSACRTCQCHQVTFSGSVSGLCALCALIESCVLLFEAVHHLRAQGRVSRISWASWKRLWKLYMRMQMRMRRNSERSCIVSSEAATWEWACVCQPEQNAALCRALEWAGSVSTQLSASGKCPLVVSASSLMQEKPADIYC